MKALFLPLLFLAASVHGAPAASAPATISKEADLTKIVLKPEAEERLRLKSVPVVRRAVPATRLFSGEVVRGLDGESGRVAPVVGGTLDEVLRLAELQAVADGRVRAAKVQVDAARTALDRAQKVLAAEAGSVRSVDEARTALGLAEAALATAREQRALLGAPVHQSGEARGLWVRTAIYSGEAPLLDAKAEAHIRALGASSTNRPVRPVNGPLTANAATATVDWYYELGPGLEFRAGERVAVEIPIRDGTVENLVVPFSAVLHDIHGGQWVYEVIAPHTYARRRVQVARLSGGDAVLATGPAAGTHIVTDGAAELFGTEFMTGK
jgi:hypothetical protein